MKTTLTTLALFTTLAIFAQEKKPTHKIINNEIVKIEKSTNTVEETNLTHTIADKVYKVYKNTKGRLFIFKTSKKTGKEYRYYFEL